MRRPRIGAVADVLPVEHVLAESPSHRAAAGLRFAPPKPSGAGYASAKKAARSWFGSPGPPPDSDLLGIPSVAHDEVVRRWIGGPSREEADREVEGAPPCVDRRRASPKRRPELGQDQRRAGGGVEVDRHLLGVIARVLVVLGERHLPGHLLGCRIDLDSSGEAADGLQHLARHLGDGPVGRQRDPRLSPVAVLDDRLVRAQIEGGDDGPRAVGRRQRRRLPAACAQPQGGVLKLGLGRGSSTASFPSTCVCAWSVSQVALHES